MALTRNYFYYGIIRKTVVGFGSLFNNIQIKHLDEDDKTASILKVPLAYGPIQKFLAIIEQQPNLNNKTPEITLPRLSFEMTGISYDGQRKSSSIQRFAALNKNPEGAAPILRSYMPVPYNLNFQLGIAAKLNEDALQIIEQILPFFQPSYNVTLDMVADMGEYRNVPIILNTIELNDDYASSSFNQRRAIVYNLNFTAKTYLYGPIPGSSGTGGGLTGVGAGSTIGTSNLTRKVTIDYNAIEGGRQLQYSAQVTPPEIIEEPMGLSLTDDQIFALGDDFGFSELTSSFIDAEL